MRKPIWISYDLGIKGDYEGLYAWLDEHGAKECGDSLAFLKYETDNEEQLIDQVTTDLSNALNLGKKERIYMVWLQGDQIKGRFLFGSRRASPWIGFGSENGDVQEDY